MTPGLRAAGLFSLAVLCLQIAWLAVLPPFHGMDEHDHAFRAASVARGHWQTTGELPADGRGQLILVPSDVVDAARDTCESLVYTGRDNCVAVGSPNEGGEVLVASAAGTYNPVYYALVGTVARPFDGTHALLAMRLTSLLLCDLLLAAALLVALTRSSSRWQVLGLALVCLPTLVYASVVTAPNAVGYCGGILLWASLLAMPDDGRRGSRWPLVGATAGIAAVVSSHSTGIIWVVAIAVCGAPLWRSRIEGLRVHHPGPAAVALGLSMAAAVLSFGWIVANGTNDPRMETEDYGRPPAYLAAIMPPIWLLQSIATLRIRDQAAPALVYALAVATLVTLLVLAWRRLARPARLAVVLVALAALLIPLVATYFAYPYVGNAWQARYGMPLYVGIYLIAITAGRPSAETDRLTCGGVALLVAVLHLATLWAMIGDETSTGHWAGSVTWRYAAVTALCTLTAALVYVSSRSLQEEPIRA